MLLKETKKMFYWQKKITLDKTVAGARTMRLIQLQFVWLLTDFLAKVTSLVDDG